jgi:hypothetical protein
MAKIYYCEECRVKMGFVKSTGKKTETRCTVCTEPAECFSGDTSFLNVIQEEEPPIEPTPVERPTNIRKSLLGKVVKEKVLSISDAPDMPENVEKTATKNKKTIEYPQKNIKTPPIEKINADFLREATKNSFKATTEVLLTEILEGAYRAALSGKSYYEHHFEKVEEKVSHVIDSIESELKEKKLSIIMSDNSVTITW